jgi:cytochrome c-type biogenesis protein CcmH/NrfG
VPQADRSTEAFAAFEQRDFPRARQLYQVLLQNDPEDGVAQVQLQRCEELMSAAWNSNTDTIHRMNTK